MLNRIVKARVTAIIYGVVHDFGPASLAAQVILNSRMGTVAVAESILCLMNSSGNTLLGVGKSSPSYISTVARMTEKDVVLFVRRPCMVKC